MAASGAAFAQGTPACVAAIKNRYEVAAKDRYGNMIKNEVKYLQYLVTWGPEMHNFGKNKAHLYSFFVEKYENGRIVTGGGGVEVLCVVDSSGKMLGIERR